MLPSVKLPALVLKEFACNLLQLALHASAMLRTKTEAVRLADVLPTVRVSLQFGRAVRRKAKQAGMTITDWQRQAIERALESDSGGDCGAAVRASRS